MPLTASFLDISGDKFSRILFGLVRTGLRVSEDGFLSKAKIVRRLDDHDNNDSG